MKYIPILLLFLGVLVSAQENRPDHTDMIFCETIDHTGFISVTEQTFLEVFYFVRDSSFEHLLFTIDVSGIIDSVYENYTRMPNLHGQVTSVPITGIVDHKTTQMKAISIKNRVLNLPEGNDSAMVRNFKAQRIFIPKSLPAKKGDEIIINDYFAILDDTCNEDDSARQKALVYGKYVLNSKTTSHPNNNKPSLSKRAPTHNRDANGRFFTKKPNYFIEY